MTRLYHVVAVNDRTGARVTMTRPDEPVTHAQGCTIMSKITVYKWRRLMLVEA